MTEAKIFLVNKEQRKLTLMSETSYATESDLQAYLANYPNYCPVTRSIQRVLGVGYSSLGK
jgi:hypothetical protein